MPELQFENTKLGVERLERLERDLEFAIGEVAPVRRGRGGAIAQPDLKASSDEILGYAQRGVQIASYLESRSLVSIYEVAGRELPPVVRVDHDEMNYDFYLVELVFGGLLEDDAYLRQARLELRIQDDVEKVERRVRPLRLFPGRKDVEYFRMDLSASVGVDFDLNISVPMAGAELMPFAKAKADAGLKAGLLVGPLQLGFRKAAVEVVGEQSDHISWRYNLASELAGSNEFKSILILKVAKEAGRVDIDAELAVTPCKKRWAFFEKVLPEYSRSKTLRVELTPP